MKKDEIILVDSNDQIIGKEEKLIAHKKGLLHRAFSIFIFDQENRLLLQKRALSKYHSAGLWSNTCCSHPRPGENILTAAHRRLKEEMGFDCSLKAVNNFIYKAKMENDLTEYEFDHLLIGYYQGKISPNPQEVEEYLWQSLEEIAKDISLRPQKYTTWFKLCFQKPFSFLKPII